MLLFFALAGVQPAATHDLFIFFYFRDFTFSYTIHSARPIIGVHDRGVQEPQYRSRLRKELVFFNRSRSRTRSGYFRLEQEPEQE